MPEAPLRITLLAQDIAGWARLGRSVSAAHATAEGGPPVVAWPVLQQYADEKLTILLGPASDPVRALSAGRPDLAEQLLAQWREVAGANLRLEVLHWGLPGLGAGSLRLAAHTLGLADRLSIPAVLTNAVRYADPAQRPCGFLDRVWLFTCHDERPFPHSGFVTWARRTSSASRCCCTWRSTPSSMRCRSRRLMTAERLCSRRARRRVASCRWRRTSAPDSGTLVVAARRVFRWVSYSARSRSVTSVSVPRSAATAGRASSAASAAVVRARPNSRSVSWSRGSWAQRAMAGRISPCTTRVATTTPAVTKTMVSRSGNAVPESTV